MLVNDVAVSKLPVFTFATPSKLMVPLIGVAFARGQQMAAERISAEPTLVSVLSFMNVSSFSVSE